MKKLYYLLVLLPFVTLLGCAAAMVAGDAVRGAKKDIKVIVPHKELLSTL